MNKKNLRKYGKPPFSIALKEFPLYPSGELRALSLD